jgi:peptidoglycan/LPS O-acetylase OafA/YrhL
MLTLLLQTTGFTEKQADSVIAAGLTNPITMFLLVIALILVVAALVWSMVVAPARRADRKEEREFRREELNQKAVIEGHRAAQTHAIQATTADLATMATTLPATASELRAALALTHKHLDRACPGGNPPPLPRVPS